MRLIEPDVSVEEFSGTTYDIEVDEDHSYVANGLVVHNCTTRVKTGFTRGTISCLLECVEAATVPLIADGGIKEAGHIAKSIACGATMVMAGMFMSGFNENSGDIIMVGNEKKYIYFGSASYNVKRNNHHIEGTQILVDYKGSMDEHIYDIECSLKSAVSYAGGKCLKDIEKARMFCLGKK